MENQQKNSKTTLAFGIAMLLATIGFIIILNQLPFPDHYGFWHLLGIFLASCFIGFIIFAISTGLMNAVLKIVVEILVVLLMLVNVTYVASCWAFFDGILIGLNLENENKFIAIIILALSLFIFDLICALVLIPLSRIVGSDVLDI
jgi:hypothetical protein